MRNKNQNIKLRSGIKTIALRTGKSGVAVHSAFLFILIIAAIAPAAANPLSGYYQVTNLTVTQDGKPVRGFNNADLYIHATDRRVKIAGAWRGYPMQRVLTVEKVTGDTLLLRDTQNRSSLMKFLVKPHAITGRHALNYDDGTRQVVETIALIRKMNHGEVDRIRSIIDF